MNRLAPEQLAAGVQDLPSLPAVVMESAEIQRIVTPIRWFPGVLT